MEMETLKLSDLSVTRGSFRLEPVNLSVNEREYLVVIGPTGSGKTTLLKTIAGAFGGVRGKILLDGTDVVAYPPEKRKIVYVPQNYSLFNHMTAYGNIEFGLKARNLPRDVIEQSIDNISNQLGIAELLNRSPLTLSGGEQQKVSLARALVTRPKILLLDEPLSMVDPETKSRLLIVLKNIPKNYNCSVMHVTHDWDETYSLADRIAVINKGRIVEVGNPESVFERPKSQFTAHLTGFQNIITGLATPSQSGSIVELDSRIRIISNTRANGNVYACVRPEWIMVGVAEGENILVGIVTDKLRERLGVRLLVSVGSVEFAMLARKEFNAPDRD